MGPSFTITAKLAAEQRAALEHLLYFNVNQERVREGIRKSIAAYGVPEIIDDGSGWLRIGVGNLEGVESLFAVSQFGHPLGVAVYVHEAPHRIVLLHVGVLPRLRSNSDVNAQVLLELMHEVQRAARRMQCVDRIEVVYSQRHEALARAGIPQPT